jgi:excisionase family DNA binding protein
VLPLSNQLDDRVRHCDMSFETPPSHPLLTAAEAAQLLRVPRSTVYELARNRRIPFLKVGRRTLFVR